MTTTNTTPAQPDAQPVKACESFTPLINGGDYRGTICCRCGEKEGAHAQPVTAAIVDPDFAEAAKRVLTPEAAARYAAGDMNATDDAGHDLIESEARIVREERWEREDNAQPVTAAHSPLPWFAPVGYGKNLIMTECGRRVALAVQDIGQTPAEYLANAALIVAAVNERPALLAERDALKARVAELKKAVEMILNDPAYSVHRHESQQTADARDAAIAALKGASK